MCQPGPHQYVTIHEFHTFCGDESEILPYHVVDGRYIRHQLFNSRVLEIVWQVHVVCGTDNYWHIMYVLFKYPT